MDGAQRRGLKLESEHDNDPVDRVTRCAELLVPSSLEATLRLRGVDPLTAVYQVVLAIVYDHFSVKSTQHLLGILYTIESNKEMRCGDSVAVRS